MEAGAPVNEAARRTGLALAPGQGGAVRTVLASKVSAITGGPGVGQTTIVNAILCIMSARASTSCCARRPDGPPSG